MVRNYFSNAFNQNNMNGGKKYSEPKSLKAANGWLKRQGLANKFGLKFEKVANPLYEYDEDHGCRFEKNKYNFVLMGLNEFGVEATIVKAETLKGCIEGALMRIDLQRLGLYKDW